MKDKTIQPYEISLIFLFFLAKAITLLLTIFRQLLCTHVPLPIKSVPFSSYDESQVPFSMHVIAIRATLFIFCELEQPRGACNRSVLPQQIDAMA